MDKLQITDIRDQQFSATVEAKGQHLVALQIPYVLHETDFHVLKAGTASWKSLAVNLVASLIVLLATFLVRWIWSVKNPGKDDLSWVDFWAALVLLVVTAVLTLIAWKLPSRRARLLAKIDAHFTENAPVHAIGTNDGR